MNIRVLVGSALALGVLTTAANALVVVNDDNAPYTLKIAPKTGKAVEMTVKAKATEDVGCKDGCTITLNGKSQTFDAKATKFTIKGAAILVN